MGKTKPLVPQIDSPWAKQVDPSTTAQSSSAPPTHPAPLSDQPGIPMFSSPSHAASAMTKTMSSRTLTQRGMLVGETHAWYGVAPSEFSRSLDEGMGKSDPDEQNRSNRSTASHRPASPAENVITKAESPSLPQPRSGPHPLWRSNSRVQENEGVKGKDMRALEPQTSPENSIERTYSSSGRESDSGFVGLSDIRKRQGNVGRLSDSTSSLARTGSSITPLPTSFTTQSQPKHITRVSSTNYSTIPGADHRPRPSNVAGDSQIQTAPSISPSMSSRAPASSTSRVAHIDGGTPPGPIKPSNSIRPVGQPHAAAVIPGSQDGPPNMRTLRETGGDASLRLPGGDGGDSVQTRIPSRPQLDPTYETGENSPLAKPRDRQGLIKLSGE